jgi:DNA-binding GntR family transcriptional regulator
VIEPTLSLSRRSQTTLVDDIVDAISDQIIHGELRPGLKIRQQQFAESLGVSRTPLREAFQRLEADGWVDLRARRGAEVRPLTVGEAGEIFTMRVVLETTAARLAAVVHTEDEARQARRLLAAPASNGSAAEGRPDGDVEALNLAFHEAVYGLDSPAASRELADNLRGYWTRALRYRLVYWSQPSAIELSRAAHETILEAWLARDADATERAVADHILTALWRISARIDDGDSRPAPALRALAGRYGVALPTAPAAQSR